MADLPSAHSWPHVANGLLLCGRHHTVVHQGFRTEGDANGPIVFHRPDGSVLATSAPPAPRSSLFRGVA